MTTFLLSRKINTFFGIFISLHFCILTRRLVHPTSPVLLTKRGPLETVSFNRDVHLRGANGIPFGNTTKITYSKFENKLSRIIPNASNHSLYKMKLLFHEARNLVSPVSAILREISM